jgi:hypothetical protein
MDQKDLPRIAALLDWAVIRKRGPVGLGTCLQREIGFDVRAHVNARILPQHYGGRTRAVKLAVGMNVKSSNLPPMRTLVFPS